MTCVLAGYEDATSADVRGCTFGSGAVRIMRVQLLPHVTAAR